MKIVPLYLPGSMFIVALLVTFLLHRLSLLSYANAWKKSGRTMLLASAALIFTVLMVQIFLASDGGVASLDSMLIALAKGVEQVVGQSRPSVRHSLAELDLPSWEATRSAV